MAITVDYGSCAKCNEKNSKAARICRACGAPLPWSSLGKSAQTSPLQNSSHSAPKISGGVSQGFWMQCAGGLVFLSGIGYLIARIMRVVPYIPLLTYGLMAVGGALWRAGSNMTD